MKPAIGKNTIYTSAKIIDITSFRPHSNPEVNKLKCCRVDGFNIITGINSEPGLYVYFPVDCQINSEFLSSNNLFRDKELNQDKTESGLFEQNCRVRSVSLKGEKREIYNKDIISKVLQRYQCIYY
jgi:hypothetical protein